MNKQLYLVTETFSYGIGEKTFILPEIDEHAKDYDVTIISHASKAVLKDKVNETRLDGRIRNVSGTDQKKYYEKVTEKKRNGSKCVDMSISCNLYVNI